MLWVKKVRISNDRWKGEVWNSEHLYRVCGHVYSTLEGKSTDFCRIGGEKVWISATLEGKNSGFWCFGGEKVWISNDYFMEKSLENWTPLQCIGGMHIFSLIAHSNVRPIFGMLRNHKMLSFWNTVHVVHAEVSHEVLHSD